MGFFPTCWPFRGFSLLTAPKNSYRNHVIHEVWMIFALDLAWNFVQCAMIPQKIGYQVIGGFIRAEMKWLRTTLLTYAQSHIKSYKYTIIYYLSVYLYSYLILSYRIFQWIGLRDKLQETPIFHRTNKGFLRFSLKPIHWILSSALRSSLLSYPFHFSRPGQCRVKLAWEGGGRGSVEGAHAMAMGCYGSRSERRKSQIGWSIFLGK